MVCMESSILERCLVRESADLFVGVLGGLEIEGVGEQQCWPLSLCR